jgi:hypothetical protein
LEIVSSRSGLFRHASCRAYTLGCNDAARGDAVFRQLVLARISEPTGKLDSLRVLSEAGIDAIAYLTLKRLAQGDPRAS